MKKLKRDNRKLPNIEISELFLVKADWNRTFMGQIVRETTKNNKEIIRGSVTVNEGRIWTAAESEEEIGNNLDELCTLKLDHKLHDDCGKRDIIAGTVFFLN